VDYVCTVRCSSSSLEEQEERFNGRFMQVRPTNAHLALTNTLNPLSLGTHIHPRVFPRTPQEHVHPPARTIRVTLVRRVPR